MKPPIKTLWWEKNALCLIDQTQLPLRERIIRCTSLPPVWQAIRELQVRGAPAIGVAAGYGLALAGLKSKARTTPAFLKEMAAAVAYLKTCRPTAYNLFSALERMEKVLSRGQADPGSLKKSLLAEAHRLYREDLECGEAIGRYGRVLIKNGMNILTHCNAGGLATAGHGTALAPLFAAKRQGIKFHVYVDETRPVLQGARLTAYELEKTRIPYTLICDNMAGWLMSRGKIDAVIVGADRIAANGDSANKIGTYGVAVLARYHGVKFYVAAPHTTFHLDIKSGQEIPIEERHPDEVRQFQGVCASPRNAPVYNPAFDITPGELITAFITERGLIRPPYPRNLARIFSGHSRKS